MLIGGIGIALGNALLAASTSPREFYLGLVVIVLGVGLLKPNVSAMVADLYPEGGARLDAGFTVFYMGINLGATLGPFVTGEAQQYFGLRAGFAVAAVFMGLGLLQYQLTQHHLGDAGKFVAPAADEGAQRTRWLRLWLALGLSTIALAACTLGWVSLNPVSLAQGTTAAIVGMAVLYFAYLFLAAKLTAEERRHALVIVVLFLGSALFWSGYEQAGSSLNLFAERYTDRVVGAGHFVIPAGWFQSLNPAFVIVFAPAFAWAVGRAGAAPSQSIGSREIRDRRDPDGLRISGHGRGGLDRRRRIQSAALLAHLDLSAAHLRRALPESRRLELRDQARSQALRRANDGHVVSVAVPR